MRDPIFVRTQSQCWAGRSNRTHILLRSCPNDLLVVCSLVGRWFGLDVYGSPLRRRQTKVVLPLLAYAIAKKCLLPWQLKRFFIEACLFDCCVTWSGILLFWSVGRAGRVRPLLRHHRYIRSTFQCCCNNQLVARPSWLVLSMTGSCWHMFFRTTCKNMFGLSSSANQLRRIQ